MSQISWSDRRKTICDVFLEAYFGHVLLGKGMWQELEGYLDTYFASIEQSKFRKSALNDETYFEACMKLVEDLKFIITKHHLNMFPVSPAHNRNVMKWLSDLLQKFSDENHDDLQDVLSSEISVLKDKIRNLEDTEILDDPEYIFKTFVRRMQRSDEGNWYYVTLLEENRDIIGHGTTGLTSWQGALFLADWFQTHEDKIRVWIVYTIVISYNRFVLNFFSLFKGKTCLRIGSWSWYAWNYSSEKY